MGLEGDVRIDRLSGKVRPLARVPGILVVAHVEPRPAVVTAFAHAGDIVGDQVVAQAVALVRRGPDLARGRIHRETHRVADAGREGPKGLRALGVGHPDVGSICLRAPRGPEPVRLLPGCGLSWRLLWHVLGGIGTRSD